MDCMKKKVEYSLILSKKSNCLNYVIVVSEIHAEKTRLRKPKSEIKPFMIRTAHLGMIVLKQRTAAE